MYIILGSDLKQIRFYQAVAEQDESILQDTKSMVINDEASFENVPEFNRLTIIGHGSARRMGGRREDGSEGLSPQQLYDKIKTYPFLSEVEQIDLWGCQIGLNSPHESMNDDCYAKQLARLLASDTNTKGIRINAVYEPNNLGLYKKLLIQRGSMSYRALLLDAKQSKNYTQLNRTRDAVKSAFKYIDKILSKASIRKKIPKESYVKLGKINNWLTSYLDKDINQSDQFLSGCNDAITLLESAIERAPENTDLDALYRLIKRYESVDKKCEKFLQISTNHTEDCLNCQIIPLGAKLELRAILERDEFCITNVISNDLTLNPIEIESDDFQTHDIDDEQATTDCVAPVVSTEVVYSAMRTKYRETIRELNDTSNGRDETNSDTVEQERQTTLRNN